MKFEINKVYAFKVLKSCKLPNEEIFWILEDESGLKHLLPAVYYDEYEIEAGKILNCTVDKINCSGKVFFEPLHPYFELDNTYDFLFISKQKTVISTKNNTHETVYVGHTENYNYKVFCKELAENENFPFTKRMKLTRIKKGIFYTELSND